MKTVKISRSWIGLILFLSSTLISAQCLSPLPSIGTAPCCYLPAYPTPAATAVCYDGFSLVFGDDFEGDAIDKDKWVPVQDGVHGGLPDISYNTGTNFEFSHPGVGLYDEYVPTFYAKVNDADPDNAIEGDHVQNLRPFSYTQGALSSWYQFPGYEINTTAPLVGIYALDAVLPTQESNGPYSPVVGSNGMIWPSFWMWSANSNNNYAELDGFEFRNSEVEDIQTAHAQTIGNQCAITVDPGNTTFGDGSEHNYYLMYSPGPGNAGGEADWFVDITETRYDAKYYFGVLQGPIEPLNCNDAGTPHITGYYYNEVHPENPMWLMVGDGVQSGAQPYYFTYPNIPYFFIRSLNYYQPLACTSVNTMTATSAHFDNNSSYTYNYISGGTINIDGTTNGPINIPRYRPNANCPGNLEALAQNKIVITGTFKGSGYVVLKASTNVCNNYTGPVPSYDEGSGGHLPIKNNTSNDQDSLSLQVKNSVSSNGQISVNLTNVSADELNQTADVMVYNMLGQLLYHGKMQVTPENPFDINLSAYASGVYLVMVKTSDKLLQRKIILQK